MARFAELFKMYRLRAGFATLSVFGRALADKGFLYEDSIFSHWQKGTRIPNNRKTVLFIISIFLENKAIFSLDKANEFLASTGFGALTKDEIATLPFSSKETESEIVGEDQKETQMSMDYVAKVTIRRELVFALFVVFTVFWFVVQIFAVKKYDQLFSSTYFIIALFVALWGMQSTY